jgi:hypothetical protein
MVIAGINKGFNALYFSNKLERLALRTAQALQKVKSYRTYA